MRRVVVTGIGLLTPLGNDTGSTWEGLVAGRSGLDWITAFDASAYESPIAGELKHFDPEQYVDPKLLRRIDRSSVLALACARQAVADAGLTIAGEERAVGVLLGTGMGSAHLIVEQQAILDEKGPRRISPFLTSHMLPDTATGLIAMETGARGPNYAVTAACATGGAS
jgi:3-oxoacyl-[acyl-carrier-protein] synthase II